VWKGTPLLKDALPRKMSTVDPSRVLLEKQLKSDTWEECPPVFISGFHGQIKNGRGKKR
jgi:hypothetical protein